MNAVYVTTCHFKIRSFNMQLYFLLPTYFLLFIPVESWSGPYYPDQKNKTIRVFIALISNWLTTSEYQAILNAVDPLVYNGTNCSTIGTDALSTLTSSLSSSQYLQVLQLASTLSNQLGATGFEQALVIFKNLLWNNVCYFMFQVLTWVANNQANYTEAGVVANGYRMVNEFTTFQRIKTIVLRAKVDYEAVGYWTAIRNSSLGTWLLWAQYGV